MSDAYIFYYPDGSQIQSGTQAGNIEEFLNFYEKLYFFMVRNLKQEKEIEKILGNGIVKGDIEKIMCWKTGGKVSGGILTARYQSIEISQIEKLIFDNNMALHDENPEHIIKQLISIETGIGFVYAVTLLHFISRGKYPIYDKFAHIALKEIWESNEFYHITRDIELEREIHKESEKRRFTEYKKNYIDRINTIFSTSYGYEYSSGRKVDRALWAYGHLFNDTSINKNKKFDSD